MIGKLSLSILDMDAANLERDLVMFRDLGITGLHIDIIDTSFADNISFGLNAVNAVLRHDFCFDIHIMVANPCRILNRLDLAKGIRVTVHSHFDEARRLLEGRDVKLGIALSPGQELGAVKHILDKASHVLVMTVTPGFGNQEMIVECVRKIREVQDLGIPTGVDGGIGSANIGLVRHADFIVVGSALVKAEDRREALRHILDGLRA